MAIAQGFGKTVHKNLIFGYDTGDMDNSFRGAPGTNIGMGPNRNYNGLSVSNYDGGRLFLTNGYTETVFVPTLGYRQVESIDIHNIYTGYGDGGNYNCCPNLFNYHGGQEFTGGTTYTYQLIYKCASGYTHPNFMYHYEYGPSGYITEYGVHTEAQRTHLGDGWYHAWNTFTTNAATTSGYKGLWYYQYNVPDKVSIAAVSIVPGTIVRPPRQFIDEGTTRSVTQGLLDLAGSNTLDLTNISYSSTGEITFDGTDDFINSSFAERTIANPTLEAIVYRSTTTGRYESIIQINNASDDALYVYPNGTLGFWPCTPSSLSVPTGQWSYVAATYNGSVMTYCVNGAFQNITTGCGDITDFDYIRIGAINGSDGERWIGKIAVAKVYDRALTQAELTQNYNHYKTRFGI